MPKQAKKAKTAGPAVISDGMFYKYLTCPHWLYFDRYGDPAKKLPRTRFADLLLEMGLLDEERVLQHLEHAEAKGTTHKTRFADTLKLMRAGVERIHRGVLLVEGFVGEPDLLEKRADGSSDFGPYYYVPVEIKGTERLTDAQRCQLSLFADLLKEIQGTKPDQGYVMNATGVRLECDLGEFEDQYLRLLGEIRAVLDGNMPEPHLTSGCKQSPWFDECVRLAEKDNDVALLYNVKKKILNAMRESGLRTLEDVRGLKPEDFSAASRYLTEELLERVSLQAEALLSGKHFVRVPFDLPESACEIYFDIEGDPLRQVEYLFGFLIRDEAGERYVKMLAERPEQEGRMWHDFLDWLEKLPSGYVVYHYGNYEQTRLDILERRYGGTAALQKFRVAMIDLNEIIKHSVVLPLYFYGLKEIGGYIGFERSKKISGGGESVAFYEDWLTKGDRKKLDAVIGYNEDDVRETHALKDWLHLEKGEHAK